MTFSKEISGFININKPVGPTSHDIVYGVRRAVGKGVKVGHAGTLDPFAGGVLILCVGGACRLTDMVMSQTKKYVTTIYLGATSNTDDPTGEIVARTSFTPPTLLDIQKILPGFEGTIQQVPPNHSAIFVDGQRAYRLARAGEELTLKSRPVTVEKIVLLEYVFPRLRLEITCGSGTYIRSLARDIGNALGVGGYCLELIRTAVGAFTIENAVSPAELDISRDLVSPLVALGDMPIIQLDDRQLADVLLGRAIQIAAAPSQGTAAALEPTGNLIALGEITAESKFQPTKVLRDTNKKKPQIR